MPYFYGFRQVLNTTTNGVVRDPGRAVVCGPFVTNGDALLDRANNQAVDAALGIVFFAETVEEAQQRVERDTPME
ncbi:hypothetical protein [Pandoraea apista]|uniref:hypothetical protein n=1 Tax=Pandoraea apista TaxID=93218 RepID=UPI00058AAEF0|nr:hypothetical protein [Pandoraea apista]AJE97261.1 hypothetical protein SG18_02105 [Pandoraea apista]AKH71226.1 hypothetical protein XM39_02105 [Pandoraea apista]AKI63498.1 hypothetical protein AA956_19425 [Pandoraea apista]